jgi:HEAT repeat protein
MTRGSWGLVLGLCCLLCPFACPVSGAEDRPPVPDIGKRVEAFLDLLRGTPPATPAAVLNKIRPLGPRAATALIAACQTRVGPEILEIMADALSSWRDKRLGSLLVAQVESPKDLVTQRTAFRLLGKYGGAADVPHLVRIFGTHGPGVTSDANAALTGVVARLTFGEARDCLVTPLRNSPARMRLRLARCIFASGEESTREFLTDLLGTDVGLDTVILPGVVKMPGAAWSDDLLAKIRPMLESSDVNLRREGAMALGRLRDAGSISALIDLLRDEVRGVRVNAQWALKSITRQRLPAQARRWQVWLDGERAWWKAEGVKHLETLVSGSEQSMLLAITALERGIVFRDEIADALGPLAEDAPGKIQETALAALKSLGAR